MKILIYNPFAGISGDMNIGAMVSLGVPESYFIETVKHLHLEGADVEFSTDTRKGIGGIRAFVRCEEPDAADNEQPPAGQDFAGGHGGKAESGHGHSHVHEHNSRRHQSQNLKPLPHRNLDDIKKIIRESALDRAVKEKALAIFTCLAEAEAKVHGKSINEVHFHEAGAIDSIIDIVCAAAAIEYLKPDRIISLPVELGGGFVKCAHGILPVPAPAVSALLENIPITCGRVNHEATTPTGAAILKTVVDDFQMGYSGRIVKNGYGLGSRDVEIPNILRVMLAETPAEGSNPEKVNGFDTHGGNAVMINCNIDDMNPELYSNVMDKLFAAGAKEVYMTPVFMKKTRPGTLLTVMTTRDMENAISEIIFLETTTAGVRSCPVEQKMLRRQEELYETEYGKLRIKRLYYNGDCISVKPEYDDMLRLAAENNVSLKELYNRIKL